MTPPATLTRAVTSRVVDASGTPVAVRDADGPADSTRRPLVLVHGTGGTTQGHFGFLQPMLATRSRVLGIDLAHPVDGEVTFAALVDQVLAVIADVGEPVALLGYSLGAVVATAAAARRPDLVAELVIVAGWMRTDAQQRLRNDIWQALADTAPELVGPYSTFCAFGDDHLHALDDAQVEALHRTDVPDAFLRAQMALNRDVDIAAEAAAVRSQTLIVAFTQDHMVPAHHGRELFGAIDDARYAELPTGHAVVFERPAQLFALVDAFLAAPDASPAGSVLYPPVP